MDEKFGRNIRSLRRASDLGQAEVAEAIGTSVAYLSQVETGRKGPLSTPQINKFVNMIGCPDLLCDLCCLAAMQSRKVEISIEGLTPYQIKELVRSKNLA